MTDAVREVSPIVAPGGAHGCSTTFSVFIEWNNTMPNWVSLRLALTGPTADIQRFRKTCIHPALDDAPDHDTFDLDSIVPMPPAIKATLDDNSAAARQAALAATGYDGWYSWRLKHWGVKWNNSEFELSMDAPDLMDFYFQSPWSAPEPVFVALTAQYPELSGRVCAIEEGMAWGLVGVFRNGTYTSTAVEISHELSCFVYDGDTPAMQRLTAHVLTTGLDDAAILPLGSGGGEAPDAVQQMWARFEQFAPRVTTALTFEFDVRRYTAWFDAGEDGDDDGAVNTLEAIKPETRMFLSSEGRCFAPIDRELMNNLAGGVSFECSWDAVDGALGDHVLDELAFVRRVTSSLIHHYGDDELWEWAAHAVFRSSVELELIDFESLHEGFVAYAVGLRQEILRHLNELQAHQAVLHAEAAVTGSTMATLEAALSGMLPRQVSFSADGLLS